MLTLLCHARPRRVLEIGTALGHMTANLTRWTDEEARVFTIDLVRGMPRAAPGAAEQQVEVPGHAEWGRFADHFGTAHKAFFITADSMTYDFGRIAPLDFAFIDGGHDLEHVLNDSRKVVRGAGARRLDGLARLRQPGAVGEGAGGDRGERVSPSRWCTSRGRRWRSCGRIA